MTTVAIRVRITGFVQGVGYRRWAVREAIRRGLRGWVRNRRDGGVEALFIGEASAVHAAIAACAEGPPAAQVAAIRREPADDDGSPDFSERPTA